MHLSPRIVSFVPSRSPFVERLTATAELVGNVNTLAKKAGMSQTGVRNYLLHSEPTRPVIEAIARAAGVSAEWLAYGRVPMCEPGSSIPIRAREVLLQLWQARQSQDHADTTTWEEFLERVRAGESDEEVPAWIRFALAGVDAAESVNAASPAASREHEEPELDENLSGQLLLSFMPELSRWSARASSSPASLLNVGRAASRALKQLQATMRANGQRPSAATVRMVLESHIHQADPKLWLEKERAESAHVA